MARDAVDLWCEQRPNVSDRTAMQRWLDAMPEVRSQTRTLTRADDELVYKVIERPAPEKETSQMDSTTERAWNDWAEDIARREAMQIVEALADEIGAMTGQLERRVRELEVQVGHEQRIRELESKLSKLSADLDTDHTRTPPLIPFKGGRNDAA
jgi:hypothetical protein